MPLMIDRERSNGLGCAMRPFVTTGWLRVPILTVGRTHLGLLELFWTYLALYCTKSLF